MSDLSRRRLFGLLAGAVAAPYIAPKIVDSVVSFNWNGYDQPVIQEGPMYISADWMPMTFSGYQTLIPNEFIPLSVALSRAYESFYDSFDGLALISKAAP